MPSPPLPTPGDPFREETLMMIRRYGNLSRREAEAVRAIAGIFADIEDPERRLVVETMAYGIVFGGPARPDGLAAIAERLGIGG